MDDYSINDILANAETVIAEEKDFNHPSYGSGHLSPEDKLIDSLEAVQAGLEINITGIEDLDRIVVKEQADRGLETNINTDKNIELENEK